MWRKLSCSFSELNLDITLGGGQSFRWIKTANNEWLGIISDLVCSLKQDGKGNLMYMVHNTAGKNFNDEQNHSPLKKRKRMKKASSTATEVKENCAFKDHESILTDYFNFELKLEDYYKEWSKCDENFKKVAKDYKGIRILRQDPVENLFSFICSANNNIPRITSMVEKLCSNYGKQIFQRDDQVFHSFPTIEALSGDAVEGKLRELGFGYRAKYISQTAKLLNSQKPQGWLDSLRKVPYREAHEALFTLPGVGSKVADCVCLMSLDKYDAIPVDTHIWQVTVKDYMPHLKTAKVLTNKIYQEIGDFYRERFGTYAGWANTVLFAADLKMFKKNKK